MNPAQRQQVYSFREPKYKYMYIIYFSESVTPKGSFGNRNLSFIPETDQTINWGNFFLSDTLENIHLISLYKCRTTETTITIAWPGGTSGIEFLRILIKEAGTT